MGNGIEITELSTPSDKLREAKNLILEVLYETLQDAALSEAEASDLRYAAKTLVVISRRLEAKEGK